VVSLGFSVTYAFRPFCGPGVDSAPSENEYQEHLLGVKAAGAWGWQLHHLHVPNVVEILELKPPGTLWATPGLLRDPHSRLFIYSYVLEQAVFLGYILLLIVCTYNVILVEDIPLC